MEVNVASLLCIFAFLSAAQAAVKVSVYYESLCPDSIRFLTKQFTPVYNKLGSDNIETDFLPYGKATHTQDANGKWTFKCQHGAEECRGNKVQACALKYITNVDKQVAYVNCVMDASYPPDAGQTCASGVGGVNDYSAISKCISGTEGDNLLAGYGNRTHALTPKITFVPTIVYDSVFDQDDQDQSLRDFKAVVCSHLSPKPSACP